MDQEAKVAIITAVSGAIAVIILVLSIWGFFAAGRVYSVWAQGKAGEAELSHAEWSRQIAVKEALAKKDSALLLSEAEIIRAHGVAEANQIIGESLKKNEQYLRYLWIQTLDHSQNKIIYVPTEANLPILEAGRKE